MFQCSPAKTSQFSHSTLSTDVKNVILFAYNGFPSTYHLCWKTSMLFWEKLYFIWSQNTAIVLTCVNLSSSWMYKEHQLFLYQVSFEHGQRWRYQVAIFATQFVFMGWFRKKNSALIQRKWNCFRKKNSLLQRKNFRLFGLQLSTEYCIYPHALSIPK